MKARLPQGMGGGPQNMQAMRRQAQKMQEDMAALQEDLDNREYEIKAGGGAVVLKISGKKQITERKHKKRANNTGTIYKREGNLTNPWIAKKNNVYIGAFKTRTDAQKALERITDIDVNDKYNMTFAQVYERWEAERKREISDKMLKNYQLAYKQCEALHPMKMRNILRSDYQSAIISLEVQGKSKSTCSKLRVLLGQLGRWAMEEGITLSNPAEDLTTVAKQKSTRETFRGRNLKNQGIQTSGRRHCPDSDFLRLSPR